MAVLPQDIMAPDCTPVPRSSSPRLGLNLHSLANFILCRICLVQFVWSERRSFKVADESNSRSVLTTAFLTGKSIRVSFPFTRAPCSLIFFRTIQGKLLPSCSTPLHLRYSLRAVKGCFLPVLGVNPAVRSRSMMSM